MEQPINTRVSADIHVEAVPSVERSHEQLEADVFRVLDAMTGDLSDIVIGPVASVNYEKGSLEFDFTVDGENDTHIQRQITSVMERLPLEGEGRFSTRTEPSSTVSACLPAGA